MLLSLLMWLIRQLDRRQLNLRWTQCAHRRVAPVMQPE